MIRNRCLGESEREQGRCEEILYVEGSCGKLASAVRDWGGLCKREARKNNGVRSGELISDCLCEVKVNSKDESNHDCK